MTRETKIGMVVAGSFLCAVGGYLGLRMRSADQSPTGNEQAATAPVLPDGQTSPNLTASNPPVMATPMVMTNPAPALTPTSETAIKNTGPVVPAPTAMPVPVPTPTAVSANDAPALQMQSPTPVDPPKVEPFRQPDPTPTPVAPEAKQPDPQPQIQPQTPPETPKPIDPLPEFKTVDPKQDAPKPVDPTPAPTLDPKPAEPQAPARDVPKSEEPKPNLPAPGSAALTNDPPAAPPRALPDPLPSVQPAGGKSAAPKAPVSDSYLEEEYRLQTGDTFAAVSKRFYFSDKYSVALQQYNRDYPIGAPNLKQDPPRLSAGTAVWIPPIRVLEKRYPTMIADLKPVPHAAVAAPAVAAAPTWTPTPARQVANTTKTYKVREGGETMVDIARRALNNPQAWNTIYQLNPSLNPNASAPIPAGTLLRVPGDARD